MNIFYKKNSRSKNIRIRIENGQVIVSHPSLIPLFLVKTFVNSKKHWIETQLKKQEIKKTAPENHIAFLGKWIPYEIEFIHKKIGSFEKHEDKIVFLIPILKQNDKKFFQELLEDFYKKEAEKFLPELVENFSKQIGKTFKNISFKKQKTRWGSCSSKGNLNFNYLIMRENESIIRYLVAHEVAHLQEMNHSKNFWNLVAQLDNEFKMHRKILKSISPQT